MLSIRQTGMADWNATLTRLQIGAADISPTFPKMEAAFRGMEIAAFASEGSSTEVGQWPALSPRYARWKAARFPGKGILRLTDRLFHSLVRRGPGSYITTSPTRLVMGTNVPYAGFHQGGIGRRRRPPISITNKQAAVFQMILHQYFNALVMRSGGQRVSMQRALMGA